MSGQRVTKQKTVTGTKREAEAELARILGSIQTGSYVDPTKMTVGELLAKWRDEVAAVEVSAKTMERYAEHVDRLIAGLGTSIALAPSAARHPVFLQRTAQERSPASARRPIGADAPPHSQGADGRACAGCEMAAPRFNPATDVNPPRPARIEMQTLSASEMRCLLAAAEGTALFVPTLLWLTTGLRRGELLGLMWRDIDFDRSRLTIVRSLEETKSGLLLKSPKTVRSTRVLPLPPVAIDHLYRHEIGQKEQRLSAGPCYQDQGLVFPDLSVGFSAPATSPKRSRHWRRRPRFGPVTIHGLRHTHITELLRAGVHPKVVSERAGHSSVAFTLQRYAHALPDMQHDAADQTQKLVGGLLSK